MPSKNSARGARWLATLLCASTTTVAALACAIGWLDVQTSHSSTGDQMVTNGGIIAAVFGTLTVLLRPRSRADEWKKLAFLAIGIWPFATFGLFIGWRSAVSAEQLDACERGDAEVCTQLAVRKERRGKTEEATPLFVRACELGDADGCLRLAARSEAEGETEEVNEWYSQACRGDLPLACVRLARRLREAAPAEALVLLERACDLADPSACEEAEALRDATNR